MDYVIQDCWTMISQDWLTVLTLPYTSSQNDLTWSFVLKMDILTIT